MAEYIEREALMRRIKEIHCAECNSYHGVRCRACWVYDTLDYIDCEPAANVAPVRLGRWIGCNGEIVDWDENNPGCPRHSCFCSICKSWLTASDEFPVIAYFCPNCGAKMDLEG